MPKINDRTVDAIKARLKLSEVVQSYIPVVSRGGRLWAKCPFHGGGNERTPSFTINDVDGFYHCFGCGESGDMFTFVQKMEHLTFGEAVALLAAKAGVEISDEPYAKKAKGENEALSELYARLEGTFSYMLRSSSEGEKARAYLSKRRVSDEMVSRFSLGYAPPGSKWLYELLSSKGYSDDILRKSGLFSQNHFPYSLFQDRLMFSVRNRQGKCIAFSGRDLSGREDIPKYVNSPDTGIYSKRHNLFGIYESAEDLKKGKIPVLVEGNFDVIAMHQAGLSPAIAPLGTAFTDEQADLIGRYTERVDIMFDSDEAGQKSTDKAIMILHRKGIDCYIHKLTRSKDAGEAVEKGGEAQLREDFSGSETAFDYLVNKNIKSYNINLPRGKSDFLKALSPFLRSTESGVEMDGYIHSLSRLLSVNEESVRKDISTERREVEAAPAKLFSRAGVSIDLFAMLYLANHRNLFRQYRSRIDFGDLESDEAKIIYVALENAMRNDIASNAIFLSLINDEKTRNDVATSFELDEYRNGKVSALDEVIDKISLRGMEAQRKVLSDQLASFSNSFDPEQVAQTIRRKAELDRKIAVMRSELYRRTHSED